MAPSLPAQSHDSPSKRRPHRQVQVTVCLDHRLRRLALARPQARLGFLERRLGQFPGQVDRELLPPAAIPQAQAGQSASAPLGQCLSQQCDHVHPVPGSRSGFYESELHGVGLAYRRIANVRMGSVDPGPVRRKPTGLAYPRQRVRFGPAGLPSGLRVATCSSWILWGLWRPVRLGRWRSRTSRINTNQERSAARAMARPGAPGRRPSGSAGVPRP